MLWLHSVDLLDMMMLHEHIDKTMMMVHGENDSAPASSYAAMTHDAEQA